MARDTVVSEIMGPRYSEFPLFEGTLVTPSRPPVAVVLFANPSSGTWTMMISPDDKTSRLILSGKDFKPASMQSVGCLSQADWITNPQLPLRISYECMLHLSGDAWVSLSICHHGEKFVEASPGIEPRYTDLQSAA